MEKEAITDSGFSSEDVNPALRAALEESETSAKEILRGCDLPTLGHVLNSARRVAAVYDGSVQNAVHRSSDEEHGILEQHGILDRVSDIDCDLQSFAGVALDEETIKRYLQHICCLEVAFYPLAAAKARLMPRDLKLETGDIGEIESVAQEIVEIAVWNLWQPSETDSVDVMFGSLRHTVMGYLRKLPYVARREILGQGKFQLLSLDGLKEDSGWEMENPLEPNGEVETSYKKALLGWYEAVRELKFPQILYIIEQLEPRLQLALLDKFHYLHPLLTLKKRLEIYGRSRVTLRNYITEACQKSVAMINASLFTGEEVPTQPLSVFVAELTNLDKPVLPGNSVRFKLLLFKDDEGFLLRLSRQKRRIFHLATEIEGSNFLHTSAEIGREIGLTAKQVRDILADIVEVAGSWEVRPFTRQIKNGSIVQIRENSAQYNMIRLLRDGLAPEQLAALTPLQQRVFYFLTTPDEQDLYCTSEQAQEEFEYNNMGLPTKIIADLEDSNWVFELKRKIETVFSGDRAGFNESMIAIMEYILDKINRGEPLKSVTNNGPAWSRIARELNLPERLAWYLKKKLKEI